MFTVTAEELVAQYSAGRRNFRHARIWPASLHAALLEDIDLSDAVIAYAALPGANLRRSSLRGTNLLHTNLGSAKLEDAQATQAHLLGANLSLSNLSGADLSGADLVRANLLGAVLDGANCADVRLGHTLLVDVNLEPFCHASPPPRHAAASVIDYRSILKSLHCPNLKQFLIHSGMPQVFIEYMLDCARTISPGSVFSLLQSTFISYGQPDADFAERLNNELTKNGVTTFFFPLDAVPGVKLHRAVRDGINEHDRVILVCSGASLERPSVQNEIDETLQREARDGGKAYLLPITLDDYVFSWEPKDRGLAQAITGRVVADFRGATTDPVKFESGVRMLIRALRR